MKILIVIPALGSVYGGTSKIAVELAQSLRKQKIEVDIVTTDANGSTRLNVPLQTWVYDQDYRVQYFPYWGWQDYKISYSLTRWLFNNICHYDLIHTISIFSVLTLLTHWTCQFHEVPYVINPQGMLEPWALAYKAWKKRIYYSLLEKPILNHASALQMLSQAELRGIQSLNLKSPAVVIPNGVHRQDFEVLPDAEIFYQKFPSTHNKNLILFLGRIDPKKGLDLLASAFAKVHEKTPKTHLVIAGPDNIGFLPTAQQYFANANCLESVIFTGMLTGTMKLAALAAASFYVAPSYSEGFSMSVLEAMAVGLPCIITTGCNFPEAAAAKAAAVVEIKAEAIADALLDCLDRPEEAKAMGDRARQFVLEHYTWDNIAANLIQVYQAILDKRPLPTFSRSPAQPLHPGLK
jgi:glycosyltransferase involved in cell wall biosynthesis